MLLWLLLIPTRLFARRLEDRQLGEAESLGRKRYRWTASKGSGREVLCYIHLGDRLRRPRDVVCPSLPSDVVFGEPFIVRSSRPCESWENELASYCNSAVVALSVQVRNHQQVGNRHYTFPRASTRSRLDCSSRVVSLFQAPRDWQLYNLAEETRRACCTNCSSGWDSAAPRGSLAREAGEMCRQVDRRTEAWLKAILSAVAKHAEGVPPPPRHAVVVHLRLGNTVDGSSHTVTDLLEKPNLAGHVPSFAYFDRVLPSSLVHGSHVVLVATITLDPGDQPVPFKSCLFVHGLKDYLIDKRNASVVDVRVGEKPDDDFAFMAQSTTFVPAAGALSHVVSTLVRHRGGTVLPGLADAKPVTVEPVEPESKAAPRPAPQDDDFEATTIDSKAIDLLLT